MTLSSLQKLADLLYFVQVADSERSAMLQDDNVLQYTIAILQEVLKDEDFS